MCVLFRFYFILAVASGINKKSVLFLLKVRNRTVLLGIILFKPNHRRGRRRKRSRGQHLSNNSLLSASIILIRIYQQPCNKSLIKTLSQLYKHR